MARVESVEQSSTSNSSKSPYVCDRMLSMHSRRYSSPLYIGTQTVTCGARGVCCDAIEGIRGLSEWARGDRRSPADNQGSAEHVCRSRRVDLRSVGNDD